MKIVLEGSIENISTRQDGTIKISFGTQELDSNKAGDLFQLRGKYSKILISDSNITELEEELVDATKLASGKKNKTPSQRLRAVLFILFEQTGGGLDFEQFYKNELEKIITHFKSKID